MRGLKILSVIGLLFVLIATAACGNNSSSNSSKESSKDGVEIKHEEVLRKYLNTLNVLLFLSIHLLMR